MHQDIETAAPESLGRLYRSPRLYGLEQSRWTLQALQKQVDWLHHTSLGKPMSLPGIWKLLRRLGVTYKRGRAHLHSPDLLYNQKMASIRSLHELNKTDPERYVLLYEDEMTYYRRAVVQQGWASWGQHGAFKVNEASALQLDQAHCRLPGCTDGPAHQPAEKYLSCPGNSSILAVKIVPSPGVH